MTMKAAHHSTAHSKRSASELDTRRQAIQPNPPGGDGRFRLAFENAPIGMAIVGTDYRLQRVNRALCEALGYDNDELITRTFPEITHPDDVERDRQMAERLFAGEIPTYRLEKRFITRDGTLAWLDLTAVVIRDEKGSPLYGLAMVEDITERKRNADALRASEERYRSFIVNSSEAIWRFEAEKPVDTSLPANKQIDMLYSSLYLAECNDAMAKLYGYERADDIVGTRFGDLVLSSNRSNLASLHSFVSNGYRLHNSQSSETDHKGEQRYFSNSAIGVVINGYLMRVWGTQRDETEQKLADQRLRRSRQQLRSLAAHLQAVRERERSHLAREMHDVLGQPLTSTKICLANLRRKFAALDKEKKHSEISAELELAIEQIEATIAAVKTLATELRPGVLDKFGLSAAIEWQCQEFQQRSGIKCDCRLPPEDVRLSPDLSTALFRILQESLANIANHSQATGCNVEMQVDEWDVLLRVRDNGRGITSEELSAPTSLGLLGMRERVELLGGKFAIHGKSGGGTILTVQLALDDLSNAVASDRTAPSNKQ